MQAGTIKKVAAPLLLLVPLVLLGLTTHVRLGVLQEQQVLLDRQTGSARLQADARALIARSLSAAQINDAGERQRENTRFEATLGALKQSLAEKAAKQGCAASFLMWIAGNSTCDPEEIAQVNGRVQRSAVDLQERVRATLLSPRRTPLEADTLILMSQSALALSSALQAADALHTQHFAQELKAFHRLELMMLGLQVLTFLGLCVVFGLPLTRLMRDDERRLDSGRAALEQAEAGDSTTGLPSYRALERHMAAFVAATEDKNQPVCVALVRIDIDDLQRPHPPDLPLSRIFDSAIDVVKRSCAKADLIAMGGANRIFVFKAGAESTQVVTRMVTAAQALLQDGIEIDGDVFPLTSFAGVSSGSAMSIESGRLLEEADIALAESAVATPLTPLHFAQEMREQQESFSAARDDLERAIAASEITAYFQPQVDIDDQRIVGFEALVRWQHPERGLLGPLEFVSLAEATGLNEAISYCMIDEALSGFKTFRDAGIDIESVGVNFSSSQLASDSLVDLLKWSVERHGLAPAHLGVEILESVTGYDDEDPLVQTVLALSRAGFPIELDDFGTGSASISSIRRFKVDRIKIDQLLLRDLDSDPSQGQLLGATIAMARAMKIKVLAEGIETERELAMVRGLGCTTVQGYLMAKPMPLDEALAWSRRYISNPYLYGGASGTD